MKLLIVYNKDKDPDGRKIEKLINVLDREKISYDINSDYKNPKNEKKSYDLVVTLGGDGTVMHGCKFALESNVPVFGINTGNLGFLTQIDIENVEKIKCVFEGKYQIEERMILETNMDGEKYFSVNDVVIARSGYINIINLDLYSSGQKVCSYKSDGVIIATPTGSTAYSLAAGGPIVESSIECFIVTPISSHSLKDRSIIFNKNRNLQITSRTKDNVMVSCDGRFIKDIGYSQSVEVKVSNKSCKFINLDERSYLKIFDYPI